MKSLSLAPGLKLPIEATTQKLAWLGTTGSGKTYGASKFAELLWKEGAQFIVLDPVGVWYGLRLGPDGKKPSSINIPIFGGLHGDIPIEPAAGKIIADLIVDKNISAIIDVSQFESDAAKARFSADFAERFYFRKKSLPSAVHLFIEECQEFVPQNPQREENRMLHAFTRMQKLGRNFGIGSSYISQRPQDVNKKALNMAQTLFVFRMTGSQERAAIEKWIQDKGLDQDIAADLPKIETGSCHAWSPEFLKISELVHIYQKETFNASATPEVGKKAKAATLSSIDVKALKADIAEVVEQAERDDPAALRRKIAELERAPAASVPVKVVDTNAVAQAVEKAIAARDKEWIAHVRDWSRYAASMRDKLVALAELVGNTSTPNNPPAPFEQQQTIATDKPRVEVSMHPAPPATREAMIPVANAVLAGEKPKLGKGERVVLGAVAQHENGITREHLTVLTGYTRSSRNTFLQRLSASGMVYQERERFYTTAEGVAELGASYEPLPANGPALRDKVLQTLPQGEARVLSALLESTSGLDRESISIQTGYTRSSRNTYIQRLTARELVEVEGNTVRAAGILF